MCWTSFKPNYSFDWFCSHDWETKPRCNMGELLVLSPFNIMFAASIVIIVISGRPISQLFSELKVDIQVLPGRLSPPMVVLKEHVIKM